MSICWFQDVSGAEAAMNLMQEVAGNVNRVMHAGYVKVGGWGEIGAHHDLGYVSYVCL